MSTDGDYTNVGIAAVPENLPTTNVGPLVVTQNFCKANTSEPNHYNRFLVGTVWEDSNANDRYDPGEGTAQVTVTPGQGGYYAVTADSGGYAVPLTVSGVQTVTFSGGTLVQDTQQSITVNQKSVLLDLDLSELPSQLPDGDVAPLGNRDGQVTVADALVCLRFALGLETPTQEDIQHGDVASLDVNNQPGPDGQLTVADALVILRKVLGLVSF